MVGALGGGFAGTLSATMGEGAPLATAGLVALEALPLVWRRRAPIVVLAVSIALAFTTAALPAAAFTPMVAALVAMYTVGAERAWPVGVGAALVAGVGVPVVLDRVLGVQPPLHITVVLPPEHVANFVAAMVVGYGGAVAIGRLVGAWRARSARLADYAARLERERAERERRAVLEERARIARELHDVAAHHLSGLVLQAGALERIVVDDPEQARRLAGDVRQGGATALASMRRLVGLLRAADEGQDERGSQPAVADLDGLAAAARRDGLDVDLAVDATLAGAGEVPDEVGLAAYRIVQEALSNTRRHAPGASARVRLARADGHLTVEVVDDGGDAPPLPADGEPGHGLIGMRERATLLGGAFRAGPRQPSGWEVRATLPLTREAEQA